jgi:hypothetical protein
MDTAREELKGEKFELNASNLSKEQEEALMTSFLA